MQNKVEFKLNAEINTSLEKIDQYLDLFIQYNKHYHLKTLHDDNH